MDALDRETGRARPRIRQRIAGVTVHSPGNKEHVLEHGGERERVHVIYHWVDADGIQPGPRNNLFARQHGLCDRFVVSYAGTMGWAQDMNTIVTSASCLRNHKNILFLLVGDGVEKSKAQTRSQELGLESILWLPMQPKVVYPEILAASDVSLINLHPELHTPVVPSKLLSIMAAARPVVASLPDESDAGRIINEADCRRISCSCEAGFLRTSSGDGTGVTDWDCPCVEAITKSGKSYELAMADLLSLCQGFDPIGHIEVQHGHTDVFRATECRFSCDAFNQRSGKHPVSTSGDLLSIMVRGDAAV